MSMETKDSNTGMRMFANADVKQLFAKQMMLMVVLLVRMLTSTGDLMANHAGACNKAKTALQVMTGMRLLVHATAIQKLAQITTTGMETNVLANAIQRLAFLILTGRKLGASAEMYLLIARQTFIMMTGDTSAFACLQMLHQQRRAITGKKQIKLANGF